MTIQTATSTFAIDPAHSTAEFSIKHLMISRVKGVFRDLSGILHLDEAEPEKSWVEATIGIASVDTGVAMRDDDLRSANFFDAERFPTMSFQSTSVERLDGERWRVHGDLTIRDVTRPVVLETQFEGRGKDHYGKERIGFAATAALNRRDFGIAYNAVLETGGVVVGDSVDITLQIEAVQEESHVHVRNGANQVQTGDRGAALVRE